MLWGALAGHVAMIVVAAVIFVLGSVSGTSSDPSRRDWELALVIPGGLWIGAAMLIALFWVVRLRHVAWLLAPSVAWLVAALVIAFSLVGPTAVTFAPVQQGETVRLDGGEMTVLGWCDSRECPSAEGIIVSVRACASEDDWVIDETEFYVIDADPDTPVVRAKSLPGQNAFGRQILAAGDCAEGDARFALYTRPSHFFYEGHGYRARWTLSAEPTGAPQ